MPSEANVERWEHFGHGADIGVRGVGRTPSAAFAQAARALTAVVTNLESVAPLTRVPIGCSAPQMDLLFVAWLNALIYQMATRGMLFSRFELSIRDTRLIGVAWGERVDRARHQPAVEVKGATLTALRVERGADGMWAAECVVDV